MVGPLADRWHSRDFPVLVEAARLLDQGEFVNKETIASTLEFAETEVLAALGALKQGAYLEERPVGLRGGHTVGESLAWGTFTGLTERGRRAVGIWPSADGADSLVNALRQAEDLVTDPEEKTLLRRASGALGSVSREVLTDVLAAVVKAQAGL